MPNIILYCFCTLTAVAEFMQYCPLHQALHTTNRQGTQPPSTGTASTYVLQTAEDRKTLPGTEYQKRTTVYREKIYVLLPTDGGSPKDSSRY